MAGKAHLLIPGFENVAQLEPIESRPMTDKTPSDDELIIIHLDLAGLAALMKAAEAAIATGAGGSSSAPDPAGSPSATARPLSAG